MQITILADNNIKDTRNNENTQATHFFFIVSLQLIPKISSNTVYSIMKGTNKYHFEFKKYNEYVNIDFKS